MSDVSGGPGWWQASDGRWYRPEQHPDFRAPAPPPAAPYGLPPGGPPAMALPSAGAGVPPQPSMSRQAMEEKSFFSSLFDFSFSSFITLRVIRVLYVIVLVLLGLGSIVQFVSLIIAFKAIGVVLAVVFVPIFFFLDLIAARIGMEVLILIFDIGKDVRTIRQQNEALAR